MATFDLDEVSFDTAKFMGLFIGPNGTGKTCAACSGEGDVKLFAFEERYLPLKGFYPGRKGINITTIDPTNILTAFDREVNALIKYCPYEWTVIDSITSLTGSVVIAQMIAKGASVKKTSGGKGVAVPSWDEFNGEAQFVLDLLLECASIKSNIIFTAHPVPKTQGDGSKISTICTFGNKTPGMIPGYFNEVYYFDNIIELDGSRRRLVTTQPTFSHPDAKTALPIPETFDIAGNKRLLMLIKEELSKSNHSLLSVSKQIQQTTSTFQKL